MEKRAVVAGHICLDIIPHVDHHFDLEPGRLYEVGAPTMATGGAVSNTGMTMHILGVPVTLMGKIGNDSFGQSVLDVIRRRAPGLEAGMTISPEADTSYSIVINIPGTDRIFLHCPGANATYAASDVNWKAVAKAHLFHFGYPSFMAAMYQDNGRELRTMYRQAKASGLTTSMDPGMPDPAGPAGKVDWKGVLAALLPDVDVFMPSADELLYMLTPDRFGQGDNLPPEELHRLGDTLLGMGAAVSAIKLGKRGMYIRTAGQKRLATMGASKPADLQAWADREMWFPIYKEDKFMGATGAGDASIAAFLTALMRGLTLRDAGFFAAAVGACNVEAPDSLGGIKSWDETMARIKSGWQKVPFTLNAQGWKQGDDGAWRGPANQGE
ncbi:MAG TPA: carbohydrate kinase family protein [Lentisphaeria bacterium]|nr:carbohydrate kinase family protein [Lentisphaerota bacterium]OQC16784.1 MAG: putative sugar kinase YdjH [Lentisphaerae bacterium ADurb.Bin082]HPY90981.1 carbohydrate kinase family protein [Lentisphaeria bacterium]HQC51876.1 carbohydrate kinase family protein [Lentisphaeria bacterium]HQL86402.1 carbohydrate kinase family protein [Lentisphaeria bacterium]